MIPQRREASQGETARPQSHPGPSPTLAVWTFWLVVAVPFLCGTVWAVSVVAPGFTSTVAVVCFVLAVWWASRLLSRTTGWVRRHRHRWQPIGVTGTGWTVLQCECGAKEYSP